MIFTEWDWWIQTEKKIGIYFHNRYIYGHIIEFDEKADILFIKNARSERKNIINISQIQYIDLLDDYKEEEE